MFGRPAPLKAGIWASNGCPALLAEAELSAGVTTEDAGSTSFFLMLIFCKRLVPPWLPWSVWSGLFILFIVRPIICIYLGLAACWPLGALNLAMIGVRSTNVWPLDWRKGVSGGKSFSRTPAMTGVQETSGLTA